MLQCNLINLNIKAQPSWYPSQQKDGSSLTAGSGNPMKSFFHALALRLSILFLLSIQQVAAREISYVAQVIGVTDGDTIKVLHNGTLERIRLSAVDCPEKRQPYGAAAKRFTSDMCFGKQVTIKPESHDRYGRTVAEVVLSDGRELNRELVKSGYAWWYQKYAPGDEEMRQFEVSARARHAGLWGDADPIAPWNFRHHKVSPFSGASNYSANHTTRPTFR